MANKTYTTMSEESIRYLCGLIRDLASVSDGILDTAICTDKTFSSYYIDLLLKQLKADSEAYTDEVASALTKLTAEVVTVEPTLDNTTNKINTILLYSPGGNDVYDQYLRLETQLISLGSTQISMADYIKTSEADNKYSTKTELKAVTDKIGTTTLTTTAQTLTGSIEEVKGIAEQGALLTVTKTQYDELVAGGTVNIDGKDYTYDSNTYYVVKDDSDTIVTTSTINSSSTDSEVPTAKAVNDRVREITLNFPIKNESNGVLDFNLLIPSEATSSACYKISYVDGILNAPNSDVTHWFVKVNRLNGELTQTAIETHYDKIYIRHSTNLGNTWSSWKRVCTTSVDDSVLTADAGSHTLSSNVVVVKNGIVEFYILMNLTSDVDSWQIIATLPIKPKVVYKQVNLRVWNGSTGYVTTDCQINQHGQLQSSYALKTGDQVVLSGNYLALEE